MLKYAKSNFWGIPERGGKPYNKTKQNKCNNMDYITHKPKEVKPIKKGRTPIKANRSISMTIEGWQALEEIAAEWQMKHGMAMEACIRQIHNSLWDGKA